MPRMNTEQQTRKLPAPEYTQSEKSAKLAGPIHGVGFIAHTLLFTIYLLLHERIRAPLLHRRIRAVGPRLTRSQSTQQQTVCTTAGWPNSVRFGSPYLSVQYSIFATHENPSNRSKTHLRQSTPQQTGGTAARWPSSRSTPGSPCPGRATLRSTAGLA
jgi:hypothetical protein